MTNHPHSQVYLLHLWQEEETGRWRISLRSTDETQRRNFAELDALFVYLQSIVLPSSLAHQTEGHGPPPAPTADSKCTFDLADRECLGAFSEGSPSGKRRFRHTITTRCPHGGGIE